MILVNIDEFDKQRFYLLTHKIKNIKSQFDVDLDKQDWAMKGRRYSDDERIARMVIGDLYVDCNFDLEAAKSKFLSFNSFEIEPYIKNAVLESASADYYYTYEKDWS